MAAVRFDGVSKCYRLGQSRPSLSHLVRGLFSSHADPPARAFAALDDVSFSIEPGTSVALVGANGAGKTTILKLMARITSPTTGSVSVSGRVSALIELGAGFHGDLTGRENVYLSGAIFGLSRAHVRRHFDDIVQFAELERFIDTPVKRYSSGMLVRLGFAVATSVDPDVLLVDEVLAVGDAAFSLKCLARVEALRSRGATLVFVSHNPYLLRAACRTALYFQRGRLMLEGTADEALRAYDRELLNHPAPAGDAATAGERRMSSVQLSDVVILADGAPVDDAPIPGHAAVEFRFECVGSIPPGPVHVAVLVRRTDGVLCCALRTSDTGTRLETGSDWTSISVRLERMRLASGTYRAEAFLLDREGVVLLTPDGARSSWFSVVGRGLVATNDAGVFDPDVQWACEPVPASVEAVS